MQQKILILDFGSQYTQLIARRIRELNVYSEIIPYHQVPVLDDSIRGVILSGSPFSVLDAEAIGIDLSEIVGKRPILGICYGAQYIAHYYGGKVVGATRREYGKAHLSVLNGGDRLFDAFTSGSQVWMSHGDTIVDLPDTFEQLAHTESIKVASFRSRTDAFPQPIYGIQFHPEVSHSLEGKTILRNFVLNIAGCTPSWTPESFIRSTVQQLQETLGDESVLLGLSGGVDSSVAAELLHQAIGDRLYCFFIDNGLLRKQEFEQVLASYETMGLNVYGIDAKDRFYKALNGISDPEQKRKIIGRVFIEVFEEAAENYPSIQWLGQGTIYPDVIESVSVHGPSVTIKSHHNVGGLPDKLQLKIVEPLRMLFKDEVREIGAALGVPSDILKRHPFPGPGLAIRILGEVTPEKVALLQEADDIFISQLKQHDLYDSTWQALAVLLPIQSVGVMGDERTYERTLVLRAVNSRDGMTAEWSRLPYDFLASVSNEIINNVKGINRVVYDISTKPPSTIEWE